ncbi:hypothetical protein [Streptosporangium sp. NPDC020145]|uniref:Uncharacterized protein n=1 Tax=Streptosporangium jomthongense TaxID=1193683 RepID=A0ABV8FBH5_9ACTN
MRKVPIVAAVVINPRTYLLESTVEARLVPLEVIAFHVVDDFGYMIRLMAAGVKYPVIVTVMLLVY